MSGLHKNGPIVRVTCATRAASMHLFATRATGEMPHAGLRHLSFRRHERSANIQPPGNSSRMVPRPDLVLTIDFIDFLPVH